MNNNSPIQPESASTEPIDLLPPSFRYQLRVRQIYCSWLTTVLTLMAILGGVTAATILRTHQSNRNNIQVATTVIPLMDLRSEVMELQEENSQRTQWCQWVETARPDDSALQTLAAIAVASQNGNRSIMIDSLHLRLPIEFPISAASLPEWAVPHISITARARTGDLVAGDATDVNTQIWLDRLNSFDRISAASMASDYQPSSRELSLSSDFAPVKLTATPISTGVLP